MIIDCVADLHGFYPELEGGDLLIVAGDLTGSDTFYEYECFSIWLKKQNYKEKIVIAGNHDMAIQKNDVLMLKQMNGYKYLQDSGTEFEGLKIWGSPWTKTFRGINPRATGFVLQNDEELAKKWDLIPNDIDILITHGPPYEQFDIVYELKGMRTGGKKEKFFSDTYWNVGSKSLQKKISTINLKLHVFGHIHEYGGRVNNYGPIFVNASHVNEYYEPVNPPIRIILDEDKVIKNDNKKVAYD